MPHWFFPQNSTAAPTWSPGIPAFLWFLLCLLSLHSPWCRRKRNTYWALAVYQGHRGVPSSHLILMTTAWNVQLITPQVPNKMNLSLTEVKKHAQWVQSLAVPQTVCIFLTVDGNPLYKEDEIPDHLILCTNGNQWSQAPDMSIYLPCVDTNTWRMWSLSSWEYDYYGLNCVLAKIRVLKSSPQLPQCVTISVDSIFKEIINLKELHWDVPYSKQHGVLIRRGNMDAHREERQRRDSDREKLLTGQGQRSVHGPQSGQPCQHSDTVVPASRLGEANFSCSDYPGCSESQFPGRLIISPGVPKERVVWNSQGGGKDKHFFFLSTFLRII